MASFSGTVRGGSLNLRQSCNTSSTKLASIPNGTSLTVSTVGGYNDWFQTSYNGQTGYVLAQYIAVTSGVSTCTVTTASGSLNIRKTPSTSATVLYTAAQSSTLYVLDTSTVSDWYRVSSSSGTGWAASSYLTMGSTGGGTGTGSGTGTSGSSNDFTDIVNTNPTVNTYYSFNPADAVIYAKAHSSNKTGVADPKRNTSFGEGASNACANFVHQCLLAGGARMFDGWCYKLTGIPSSWNSESWTYTNKGRRRLLEKKWIYRIPNKSVKAGDIIYTYRTDYVSKGWATPFQHVTIAITDYDESINGCYVCGHTQNQNNKKKTLPTSGTTQAYCYRVKTSLGGDGNEKAIDLTNGNSHAI